MDGEYVRAVRTIALRDVSSEARDPEYSVRRLCRWYSKTFYTPLLQVLKEVSIHDVLVAYFESGFEGMDEEEIARAREELSMTAAEWDFSRGKKEVEDVQYEREAAEHNARVRVTMEAKAKREAEERETKRRQDAAEERELMRHGQDEDVSMRFDKLLGG